MMKKLMRNCFKRFANIATAGLVAISSVFGTASVVTVSAAEPTVRYTVHMQNYGTLGYVQNGQTAGKTGQSLRMEALWAYVDGIGGGIEYRTHVQNIGWTNWVSNNRMSGTSGQSLRVEDVQMRLYGDVANYYTLTYRAHCQNYGWRGWVTEGQSCGTTGQSLRMEGIEIRLVKKNNSSTDASWNELKAKYPSNSYWNGSYENKASQCHGFALTLGKERTNTDPYNWSKADNLNNLKPGDIIRFNRPHSIMVTGVSGNTITYVDSNWVGTNIVKWDQTCDRGSLTRKFGSLAYVLVSPR